MNMDIVKTCALRLLVPVLALAAAVAAAAPLPIYSDFDADTPGNPPATGGDHQPSSLALAPGNTITVVGAANGISTQPCLLEVASSQTVAYAFYEFPLVTEGVLRADATVAFDGLCDGFFLQAGNQWDAVATRLTMTGTGEIRDYHGTILGTYAPGTPFGVRMDIDMDAKLYAVTIDDEMNGFDDDVATAGLDFVNDPSVIDDIALVSANYYLYAAPPESGSLAYDDIVIRIVDPTSAERDTWGGVKRLYR